MTTPPKFRNGSRDTDNAHMGQVSIYTCYEDVSGAKCRKYSSLGQLGSLKVVSNEII